MIFRLPKRIPIMEREPRLQDVLDVSGLPRTYHEGWNGKNANAICLGVHKCFYTLFARHAYLWT